MLELTKNMVPLIPNAANLIESMRSIGYSFETALADVIDNSISAQASKINVYLQDKGGVPFIQIIDDGWGMNDHELVEAMRLGSKNPMNLRNEKDLGRFGLGLKSASFSQCRVLTAISKKNDKICGYQWNLDQVAESDKFEVLMLTSEQIDKLENIQILKNIFSGTIIQWSNFDRINHAATSLKEELTNLMYYAIDHLSLIYHRYLEEGLQLLVNNTEVKPKDPFLINHSGTQIRPSKIVKIDGESIHLQPYVIPYFSKLSTEDKRKLGKANDQYRSQGFYLYRNKRLIVWGDYLGLARKSELGINLRIQVDIPNSLDYLWEIDIKKSRASVPSKIKKSLLSSITDGESISKRLYKFRGNREINNEQSIWNFIEERDGRFRFEINLENNIYQELLDTLNNSQRQLINILIKGISDNLPVKKIYAEMADGRSQSTPEAFQVLESLKEILDFTESQENMDKKQFCRALIVMEPFSSDEKAIELLNNYISGGDRVE